MVAKLQGSTKCQSVLWEDGQNVGLITSLRILTNVFSTFQHPSIFTSILYALAILTGILSTGILSWISHIEL